MNSNATLNGNAVLGITQHTITSCCHGDAIVAAISNGENGDNGSPDLVGGMPNTDVPNATPANSVFTTIGNPSGRLENGNVIRISAWFRSDPVNPITVEPQVAPILKMEYWKEGLSGTQDSNAVQAAPGFGDRVFDQDQQGYALTIPDPPSYVDINNNGSVVHDEAFPPQASAGNGRLFGLATDHWTLAQATHTVNSVDWLGIGAAGYGFNDVTRIEAIKGVIFLGEFASTDTTPDGADGGTLLIDNMLIEVFRNAAAVTANTNPNPTLSEGLPGDYNNNQVVDAADYVVWRNGGPLLNEGASSGVVDQADYDFWRARFGIGSGAGAGAGVTAAVPEPASCGLAALALIVVSLFPRRRTLAA